MKEGCRNGKLLDAQGIRAGKLHVQPADAFLQADRDGKVDRGVFPGIHVDLRRSAAQERKRNVRISAAVFGIPAVKGLEFGAGFAAAESFGSVNNDPFVLEDGEVRTATNHAGGILGGITDGMPLTFRAAFKPTPSISIPQRSVDLRTMTETELIVTGRHDPCIVPRAVPCVEAAAAVAVYDALLGRRKEIR